MPRGDGVARLDRDKILTAALAVADRHGLSRMTLRMVGSELGADPTAVYRHFANKDALVAAMADRLFVEVVAADYPDDWRERFIALIRAVRDLYRAHPTIVDALANLPEESPGLVAINELSAGCLAEAGVDPVRIGLFHQFVAAYMVGTGVLEGSWSEVDGSRDASRRAYLALDPQRFPNCVAIAGSMFPEGDDVLEFVIEILLDAIVRVAGPPAGARQSTVRQPSRKKP